MVRRRISRLRTRSSFQRRAGQRQPRSITLIVCEGETEQFYLDAARIRYGLTTAEIVIAEDNKGSAPINVVNFAEARCSEPGGYDKVFCVFDRNGHESYPRAREKVRQLRSRARQPLPIEDIVSIPCFEVWVLLHFERTDRPFTCCTDVVQYIRNNHLTGYEKAAGEVSTGLVERVETAKVNARWLAERAGIIDDNPFTAVHKVIEHFAAVAGSDAPASPRHI